MVSNYLNQLATSRWSSTLEVLLREFRLRKYDFAKAVRAYARTSPFHAAGA